MWTRQKFYWSIPRISTGLLKMPAAGRGSPLELGPSPFQASHLPVNMHLLTECTSKGQLITSNDLSSLQGKHYQPHLTDEKIEVRRGVAICKNMWDRHNYAKLTERKLRLRKVEQQPTVAVELPLRVPFRRPRCGGTAAWQPATATLSEPQWHTGDRLPSTELSGRTRAGPSCPTPDSSTGWSSLVMPAGLPDSLGASLLSEARPTHACLSLSFHRPQACVPAEGSPCQLLLSPFYSAQE